MKEFINQEYEITLTESSEWKGYIVMLPSEPLSKLSTGFFSINYILIADNISYTISKELPIQIKI